MAKPTQVNLPDGISPMNIGIFTLDSDQKLWVSINGRGVAIVNGTKSYIIDADKGLITPFINTIVEDSSGNIWLTTRGNGLIQYANNKFLSLDFSNDIDGNIVRAIYQDSKNRYWFSITGKGIIEFKKNIRKAYTPQDHNGLLDVRDFLELKNGKILMASFRWSS